MNAGGELNQPWQRGDEITARRLEALRRGVVAGDADGGGVFIDSTGRYRRRTYQQGIELWEVYTCTLDGESHEYKIEAYPVYLDEDTRTWRTNTSADLETLWFPAAFHDPVSPYGAIGPKSFGPGRRVYTRLIEGRRCVLGCPVETCRFELKTSLSPDGYATAWLREWGGSAWTNTATEIVVYDLLAKNRGRAAGTYAGSKGVAVWSDESQRWEILDLQPMAMLLWADVDESSGVAPTDASFAVDGATLLQPIGGVLDSLPTTAYNPLGLTLADNDKVLLAWNETATRWDAIAPSGASGGHAWGKVQTGFSNDSGEAARTVSVKACAWDGSGEAGDAFDVKTPLRANKDTALFAGYVVRFSVEADATLLIDSDCWDDPIGTGRWVNRDDAVRDGWEEVTAVRDRFVKGKTESEDYEDTGGAWPAAHGDHTIAPTHTCINAPAGSGINVYGFASSSDVTLEHTNNHGDDSASGPPWYAQKFIRRTS